MTDLQKIVDSLSKLTVLEAAAPANAPCALLSSYRRGYPNRLRQSAPRACRTANIIQPRLAALIFNAIVQKCRNGEVLVAAVL
jgi:hypothetical protein